jgi:hypothetical protein
VIPQTNSADFSHSITNITTTTIDSKPFMSERFPLYPIIIGVSLKGDAFNFIEVSCPLEMQPNGIIIQLSNDGDAYNTVG